MIEWPSVLAFTITYSGKDYVYEEFKSYLEKLDYPNVRHIWIDNSDDGGKYHQKLLADGFEAYHVDRGNNSREALARSQNFARKIAIDEDYDYLLSIESDLLFHPQTLMQLIADERDVVGVRYNIGPPEMRIPCITVSKIDPHNGLRGTRLLEHKEFHDYTNKGLRAVNGCGLGFTLIKKEVFHKIQFTYYSDIKGHSDIFFNNDVWNNGWRVYCNTSVYCEHKNVPWTLVDDR